jgi:hypothetical protein
LKAFPSSSVIQVMTPSEPRDTEALATRTPSWAERLVRILDDGLRIPGTSLRFGLDGILGLVAPAVGDAATGLGSMGLLALALRQRVPTVVLLRMVMNIGVDVIFGAIPVIGDVFDFAWKSNRRNLDLIERFRQGEGEASATDYMVVGLGFLLAAVAIALPFVMLTVGFELISRVACR